MKAYLPLALGLVVWLAAIMAGLWFARSWTRSNYDTQQSQQEWQAWRSAAAELDGTTSPVKRRPPKSERPPLVVWMTDFFPVAIVGGLVFGTAFYVFTVVVVGGAFSSNKTNRRR